MTNQSNTPWTETIIIYLRDRAAERWPAVKIAVGIKEEFGIEFTPNAVVGKARRENIQLIAHIWPEEAVRMLRDLASRGFSAPTIAQELNAKGFAYDRKHVRDKARSGGLTLVSSVAPKQRISPPVPQRMSTRQRLIEKRMSMVAQWVDYESDPIDTSHPATLIELKSHQCKWPLRRNDDGDRLFCGGFKLAGPYCTHHHDTSINQERISQHGSQTETVI
jgi:hypothetical protein